MGEPISDEALAAAAEQRRAEQVAEYGQFVAAQDIRHDGGLAYLAGSAVPVSNVKLHGYLQDGLVITVEQATQQREAAAKAAEDARVAEQAEREAAFAAALKSAQGEAAPAEAGEPPEADPAKKPGK